jgi:hypothetical protein
MDPLGRLLSLRMHKSFKPQPCRRSTTASIPSFNPAYSALEIFILRAIVNFATIWLILSFYFSLFGEMFSKSLIAPTFLLALTSSVNAHAAVAPPLGVKGTPTVNDVQKPSTSALCGTINIADNLDTSTPVVASTEGEFFVYVTNFG